MEERRDQPGAPWYETYFGSDYLLIDIQKHTAVEARFLARMLGIKPGTKLLDAPCGYGRHVVPLARLGAKVTGIDLSEKMLAAAKRSVARAGLGASVRLMLGDIREMTFRGGFDCCINMFNSIGYFDDDNENYRVLTSLAGALKPGGLFFLDLVNRDFLLCSVARKDWQYHRGAVILETKSYDPIGNRSEIDVSVVDARGKRDYHHSIRLYTLTEMALLLESAGFELLDVFGGFRGEPFTMDHDRMLLLCRAGIGANR